MPLVGGTDTKSLKSLQHPISNLGMQRMRHQGLEGRSEDKDNIRREYPEDHLLIL